MPNQLRVLGAAVIVFGGGSETGRAWADPAPTVTVLVDDQARLPNRTLEHALMIAGGVYRRAGVSVRWLQPSDTVSSDSDLTIVLVSAAAAVTFRTGDDSMGVARAINGRRNTAYVFYDRVRDFGEHGHIDGWIVLGCAIAHELGHLLLPVNAHTRDGIMRAGWDPRFLVRERLPTFEPDQARLLRLRVASRESSATTGANRYHE